ncbi:hypothetical protein [Paracidovorax anthurii]|uniref:hypothetical protein n=1 Tax=Paracidovorax anthurii TaxID=78229 RepID=UPI001FE947BB|nr:hypothetical protein [Paracidovorax anthurii]
MLRQAAFHTASTVQRAASQAAAAAQHAAVQTGAALRDTAVQAAAATQEAAAAAWQTVEGVLRAGGALAQAGVLIINELQQDPRARLADAGAVVAAGGLGMMVHGGLWVGGPGTLPDEQDRGLREAAQGFILAAAGLAVAIAVDPRPHPRANRQAMPIDPQPAGRIEVQSLLHTEALDNAINIVAGLEPAQDPGLSLGNALLVMDHLYDAATLPEDRLHLRVRQAVLDANDDPQQIIQGLLRLVTAEPPLLSSRSAPQAG